MTLGTDMRGACRCDAAGLLACAALALVLAALGGSAAAQGSIDDWAARYGATAPGSAERPLAELVPEDPAAQPLEDVTDAAANLTPTGPDAGAAAVNAQALRALAELFGETGAIPATLPDGDTRGSAAAATPGVDVASLPAVPEGAPGPYIAATEAPTGWVTHSFEGHSFALPDGWVPMEENDDTVMYFGGDPALQKGPGFGLIYEDDPDALAEFEAGDTGAEVVFADGQRFRLLKFSPPGDVDMQVGGWVLRSVAPMRGEDHLILMLAAFQEPYENHAETLAAALGSLRLLPPGGVFARPLSVLGGAVTFQLPTTWTDMGGSRDTYFQAWPDVGGAGLMAARGASMTGEFGEVGKIPEGTPAALVMAFGHPARLFEWHTSGTGDTAEVTRQYIFSQCLGGTDTIGLRLTATPVEYASAEMAALIGSVRVEIPDDAPACPADTPPVWPGAIAAGSPLGHDPLVLDGAAASPAATAAVPALAAASVPRGWLAQSYAGASFHMPPDWPLVEERDDSVMYFGGDMATQTGPTFGLMLERHPDEIEQEADISDRSELMIGEMLFHRLVFAMEMAPGKRAEGVLLYSDQPVTEDEYLMVSMMVIDADHAQHAATYDAILATLVPPPPAAAPAPDPAAPPPVDGAPVADHPQTAEQQLGLTAQGRLPDPPAAPVDPAQTGPFARPAPEASGPFSGSSPASESGIQQVVGGVRFRLPEGWVADYDSADDKIFHSPDGRLTVLSFWWLPDEPLAAYDDVVSIGHTVLDHEPMSRIVSRFPDRTAILMVSERARPDGRRFIFTLEGAGATEDALGAVQQDLAATLQFGAAFEGSGAALSSPPATATAAATPKPAAARRIGFAQGGTGGWTGDHATLSNPGAGAPDGRGFLSAYTPGDGVTGYVIAPAELLGDWRGHSGLQVTLVTGEGRQVDPYDFGGRGDVYLANGAMTASRPWDRQVGAAWQTETVRFDDAAGWRLGGGARQLSDVLANVTEFQLRAEFLEGDAEAGIHEVVLLGQGAAASGAVAAPMAAAVTVPQPPQPLAQPAESTEDPDSFTDQGGGYTLYRNDRYGTFISYPGVYFIAQPAPANGDGRSFVSVDGAARFYTFSQFNAMAMTPDELAEQDKSLGGYDSVTYERISDGWYVLSGRQGDAIFYRRAIVDGPDGLLRVFEISYPAARKAEFDAVVAHMAHSFGPGTSTGPSASLATPAPAPAGDPGALAGRWAITANGYTGQLVLRFDGAGWAGHVIYDALGREEPLQQISFDPATGEVAFLRPGPAQHYLGRLSGTRIEGNFNQGAGSSYRYGWTATLTEADSAAAAGGGWAPAERPRTTLGKLYTPARKTPERQALMDAARGPIEAALGLPVIFVVSVLKTDGAWAYLQATPVNPDGTPIAWSRTRYADEMAKGVMSDVAMVLMARQANGWQVVDHVMGPTDVFWISWQQSYGLPEALFTD